MNQVDDARIQALTAELDTIIPREGAVVRIQQGGGGPDESFAVGNQLGYLRLGVALLQAAFAPPTDPGRNHIPVDDSVLDDTSDVVIQWFERREDIVRAEPVTPGGRGMAGVAAAAGLVAILLIFLVGMRTTVLWLLG